MLAKLLQKKVSQFIYFYDFWSVLPYTTYNVIIHTSLVNKIISRRTSDFVWHHAVGARACKIP